MAHCAVRAVAVGDKAVGAGFGLQHVGEVFGAHGGLLRQHVGRPHDVAHHPAREVGLGGAVDGGRVIARKAELAARLERGAGVLGDFFHAFFRSGPAPRC